MMHAGAGDTMVSLVMESGSAGNDLVGDAAESMCKRLLNITGVKADVPSTLVQAQAEGGILLERLRRAPPRGRVFMGAVLKRLIFEAYNTRAAAAAAAGATNTTHTAGQGISPPVWQIILPLPLSAMPSIKPDIMEMLTGAGDMAKYAAARSAGALATLSIDTHLELMEANARASLVAACGADVLDALTIYIRRHAEHPSEPYESISSAVDEMMTLCAAAGSTEDAASRAKLAGLTMPALVAALAREDERDGGGGRGGGRLQIVLATALRATVALPQVLAAAASAGAAAAALQFIERSSLPTHDPSLQAVDAAYNSVITLWELLSDEQPTPAGGALQTYSDDCRVQIRSVVEETFYEVTALCPSLTARAVVSLISLLRHLATDWRGDILAGRELQPADIRVTAAALGLVRFWCADDFNRRTLALAGAGFAATRLITHPNGAIRRSAARATVSLAAFPAVKGVTHRLALAVGPLATSASTLDAPEGLSSLLDLAVVKVALAAEDCCVEALLPLRDDTTNAAMDVRALWTGGREGQEIPDKPSSAVALDAIAAFLLEDRYAPTWHASAVATLAALPTSEQARLVARGALRPLIACIGGEATQGVVAYLDAIVTGREYGHGGTAPSAVSDLNDINKDREYDMVVEATECVRLLASLPSTDAHASDVSPTVVNTICALLEFNPGAEREDEEAAAHYESSDYTSSLGGWITTTAATAATAAVDTKSREIGERHNAGIECTIIALHGRRDLAIMLSTSPRLVPALLALLARPDGESGTRARSAEALAVVVNFLLKNPQASSSTSKTYVATFVVPVQAMEQLRVMLSISDRRQLQLAAAVVVEFLARAPVTAATLMHVGCGTALATISTDSDTEIASAACDALRRLAGVDPSAPGGVLSRAIDAGLRAVATACDDAVMPDDDHRCGMSERDHVTAVLLQVLADAITQHHPDCATHASTARTPARLRSIATMLTANVSTPSNYIVGALAALGVDTLTELASDPSLLGPLCQLVGPAAAPAFAAQLELVDPRGEAAHVIDLAHALASLEPMLARAKTQSGLSLIDVIGYVSAENTEDQACEEWRRLVAASFIRAVPPLAALLTQGTSVGRPRAIISLNRLASVCSRSVFAVMAAHNIIAATASELETTAPASGGGTGLASKDGLVSAIETKREATSPRHGIDAMDGNGLAVTFPVVRDSAVQLLAALFSAAGDEVSSATTLPTALARAVAFAAVDSIDVVTISAALNILRSMTSGAGDRNRRTVYEAGVIPVLLLFLKPEEDESARIAAAGTLRNLSAVNDVTFNRSANVNNERGIFSAREGGGDVNAGALVLTRLQDAVAAIIAAHHSTVDTFPPQPWPMTATHPLLRRLLHEIHVTNRGGDGSGPGGGTHVETEAGILHLTRLLAEAHNSSGVSVFDPIVSGSGGKAAGALVDDHRFGILGAWLRGDNDGETEGGESRNMIELHSDSTVEAALAGLLALPLDAHVSMMMSPTDGGGLIPLVTVIGRRAAPGLVGVINADVGATAAVAAALLGRLAAHHDARSSIPVAVAERSVVPIIVERLMSHDPRVRIVAAASCLALAELAPRLRGALAGAGVLPLLMAGVVDACVSSAALYVRALWALLQDDDVWRAAGVTLRVEVRLGDSTAKALVKVLQRSITADGNYGLSSARETMATSAVGSSLIGRNDTSELDSTTSMDAFLTGGIWGRLGGQFAILEGPASTHKAVVGLIWRTTQCPESRVSLIRAGAPSALAAAIATAAPPHCLEGLLLCSVPGYIDGDAPQQPLVVAAAARQLERLARQLILRVLDSADLGRGVHATQACRWIGAVVGQLAEETARLARNLPDNDPADIPPLHAASFVEETTSRLAAISDMLLVALSASLGTQLAAPGIPGDASSTADHTEVMGSPQLAHEVACTCAGALQLLQPSTHAEFLRCGAAAGLVVHLGPESERKAHILLAMLTVAADAGHARGAAAVSRELWRAGAADSGAATVAVRALPVLARLLMIPRATAQHEAALGFYWVGRLRSWKSRWRACDSGGAIEASISSAERNSIGFLLAIVRKAVDGDELGRDPNDFEELVATGDSGNCFGEGQDGAVNITSVCGEDIKSVAEACTYALCTMAAVPSLGAAILDASSALSVLKTGLTQRTTRRAILTLLLTCAKHDECKARFVVGDLVEALLSIASQPHLKRSSNLKQNVRGSQTEEWWVNPKHQEGDDITATAAMAAQAIISLFEWGKNVDGNPRSTWLTDAPRGGLREPANVVIIRARAAAADCLALANLPAAEDGRLAWCDDVHPAALRALAATACTAAYDAGGASLPATAPTAELLAAAVCFLPPLMSRETVRDDPGASALRRALFAWHPDIQASIAIANHGDRGNRMCDRVEALASAGGVAVIWGLLAVAFRVDARSSPILGLNPRPAAPSPTEVCVAVTAAALLIKETFRQRIISTDFDGVSAPAALTAWEAGTAVTAAVVDLFTNLLSRVSDERTELMDWFEDATIVGSSDKIKVLITSVHEAFTSAGPDAVMAAATNPELLFCLREIIGTAPIPIRTAAASAAVPIINATLAAAAMVRRSGYGMLPDCHVIPPMPRPLTLKEVKSAIALVSFRNSETARAGAELLLAYATMPGARQIMLEALVVDKLIAVLSISGVENSIVRVAAACTLWRLLFGPTIELPNFATDGGTTVDPNAADATPAAKAAMFMSDTAPVHNSSSGMTRPEVGRTDTPAGSERWRALRAMRDERRELTRRGEDADFEDSINGEERPSFGNNANRSSKLATPLAAPTLSSASPPMLRAAAHRIVRLLVLLVRCSWGKDTRGVGKRKGPRVGTRLGNDDSTAAATLLEHLVYESISLGVLEHSECELATATTAVTAPGPVLSLAEVGTVNNSTSWASGLARVIGLLPPVSMAIGVVQSGVTTPSNDEVVDTNTPLSLGSHPPAFMTPIHGVQPLIDMLRGGADAVVMEALRPAFQALSLRTKLAVAEGGAHDELVALIGTAGCGDLMIHMLISRGESGTGAVMSGEGVPELADAIAAMAAADPLGAGAAAASAVPALLRLVRRGNYAGRRRAAAAIWSLSIGSPAIITECHRVGAASALLRAVHESGGDGSGDEAMGALWVLASTPDHAGLMIAAEGVPIAVEHLVRGGLEGREAAAAFLGACATAPGGRVALIDAGAVEAITDVLCGPDDAAAAAAAATVRLLASAGSTEATTLAQLAECVVRPPDPARLCCNATTSSGARHICALIEQLTYDLNVEYTSLAVRVDDLEAAYIARLVARETVNGASRARAIAALLDSVAISGSSTLCEAVAAAVSTLSGTTLTRLVSVGATVLLRALVSYERLAPPLLEYIAAEVALIGSRSPSAGGLVLSARALAYMLNDSHYRSDPEAAQLLRRSIIAHFPRLVAITSDVKLGSDGVLAAVGTLHALAAADGDLLLAAAEAGALGSLAFAMRRFGPDPAGVAAAAALWTLCALGPETRDTLVGNGVVALAVTLLRSARVTVRPSSNNAIISLDAPPASASGAASHYSTLDMVNISTRTHQHVFDARARITSSVDMTADNDCPMSAPLAGVGLLACLITEPGAIEEAATADVMLRLVELLDLHCATAGSSASETSWVAEAAEAAALVLRAMFGRPGLLNDLVAAGAVGALVRVIRCSDGDDHECIVGHHAVAALVAAMDGTTVADRATPAVSFAVEQACDLASRLLSDDSTGPGSSAVLEALVLDVLFAQFMRHLDANPDGGGAGFVGAPPQAFQCRAAVHALLVDTTEGSDARRAVAAGAVSALSIQSKAAVIRAGSGVLHPLVAACGPWAAEVLVHYLMTSPDTRHVETVARMLRAIAEGEERGWDSGAGSLLPAGRKLQTLRP
jgi:hypothetical protein